MFALAKTVREWEQRCLEAIRLADRAAEKMLEFKVLAEKYKSEMERFRTISRNQETIITQMQGEIAQNRTKIEAASTAQFTQKELRELRSLVHPDKHPGRQSATSLAQKVATLIRDEEPATDTPTTRGKKYKPGQGEW